MLEPEERIIMNGAEAPEENACPRGGSAGETMPPQFETVRGKTVSTPGAYSRGGIAVVSYAGSGVQGFALPDKDAPDLSTLAAQADILYDDGFLESENEGEIDSVILPIDAYDLSPENRGLILDCDLRGYTRGFARLTPVPGRPAAQGASLKSVCAAVGSFVKTVMHLHAKGCRWQTMDGHAFFFNAEYGTCRYVFDTVGIRPQKDGEAPAAPDETARLHTGVSEAVMYLLTGAWPEVRSGLIPQHNGSGIAVRWNNETRELTGDPDAVNAWNALPEGLRDVLALACFTGDPGITPEIWAQVLQSSVERMEACVHCGREVFVTGCRCPYCGKSLSKEALRTKWAVQTGLWQGDVTLAFGRGAGIPGEFFGIPTGFAPFLKLMYNPDRNLLGVRNLSGVEWTVTASGASSPLPPGAVAALQGDTVVEFKGHPGVRLRFLGYEC